MLYSLFRQELKAFGEQRLSHLRLFRFRISDLWHFYPPKNKNKCINLFLFYHIQSKKTIQSFFETKKKPELKVEAAQPMPPQMMLKMNTNTASPT